jgi:putative transposase
MVESVPLWPQVGRKAPAGGAHIHSGERNFFFVTVNAKDRVPWMAQHAVQDSLMRIWREEATAWLVGYYVLMPEHLHFFCAPHELHFGIDPWIKFWKSQFSRAHLAERWEFQRRSLHHRLRNQREYEDKLQYVRENPLRNWRAAWTTGHFKAGRTTLPGRDASDRMR